MRKHITGALNPNNNNKNNTFLVRAVSSANMPFTYDISFKSIVEAYEDCLSKKRGSLDFLRYLQEYQTDLYKLWEEIACGIYDPDHSKSFIRSWPVYREIFAAEFRDRIVHHWWARIVNPMFEQRHNEIGNVAKNCRKGQGQLVAVKEIAAMLNEHPDWWIGHFDIEAFFISIDKDLLYEMLDILIRDSYEGNIDTLLYITQKLVFYAPQENAEKIGPARLWAKVPKHKSLFARPKNKGCAIGNLPSQLCCNFIGSVLDYYIVCVKKINLYVRFSDDIFMMLPTREAFDEVLPDMRKFLKEQLLLKMHPNKVYIQPAKRGVMYVGAMILPGRTYISNRTRGRMYDKLNYYNTLAEEGNAVEYLEKFVQSMNSYLGMTVHHCAYNVRKKFAEHVSPIWWQYVYMSAGYKSFVIKKKYKSREILKRSIKNKEYIRFLTLELETSTDWEI